MQRERIIKYPGKDILVHFSVDRCTHVVECLRGAPEVFNVKRQPWIEPDAAEPDKVAEVVMRCPTGALHFGRTDGGPSEPVPEKNILTLNENGPIYIEGDIHVLSGDGTVLLEDTRISLCRCGESQHMPFCDGIHTIVGFIDAGKVQTNKKEYVEKRTDSEKLQVTLQPNGPLILKGPFIIKNADGEIGFQGNRAALCRCGMSKKRPFCDGSHVKIGFTAE